MSTLKVLACTPALIDNQNVGLLLDSHPSIFCGPETHLFSHPLMWKDPRQGVEKVLKLEAKLQSVDSGYSWKRPSSAAVQYYLTSLSQLKSGADFFETSESFYQWLMAPRLILEKKKVACDLSEANIIAADIALQSGGIDKAILFHMTPETFIVRTRGKFPLKLSLLAWMVHHGLAQNLAQKYGSQKVCLIDLNNLDQTSEKSRLLDFLKLLPAEGFTGESLRLSTDPTVKPENPKLTQQNSEKLSDEESYNLRTITISKQALSSFIENPKPFKASQICQQFGYKKIWNASYFFKNQKKLRKPDLPRDHKNHIYNFFANIQA